MGDTTAKGLPTLSLRHMQDTIEDMDIVAMATVAIVDMELVTMMQFLLAKGLLTLNLRQMQATIEDMDIVDLDTMGMADMDSMDVDIMEKGLQILKPMLDTCTEVMDTMVSDISMDMDLAMAGVTIMVRLPWTLCLRFIF